MVKCVFSFSLHQIVMSSITLTLTGNTSSLNSHFYPEIELDEQYSYSACLLDLYTFNSIPNINKTNNSLVYSNNDGKTYEKIVLPIGAYEIDEILELLDAEFKARQAKIKITTDKTTMKCSIYLSSDCLVSFAGRDSIGSVLGFAPVVYGPNSNHVAEKVLDIQSNAHLRIDCDLITGSYHNGTSTHTIYEFSPSVDPGYKIVEQPKHLIYLPVVRHRINTVNISILDEAGKLANFRGENITCRIHIKRDT